MTNTDRLKEVLTRAREEVGMVISTARLSSVGNVTRKHPLGSMAHRRMARMKNQKPFGSKGGPNGGGPEGERLPLFTPRFLV